VRVEGKDGKEVRGRGGEKMPRRGEG